MAKTKKRTKQDARGYTTKINTSHCNPNSTAVVGKSKTSIQLSQQAQEEITRIVDHMKEYLSTSSKNYKQEPICVSLSDKKQVKRIATLNNQLEQYGFHDKDILRFFCAVCNGEAVPWFLQRTTTTTTTTSSDEDKSIHIFDLDLALDWLSYHVDSQDLPPLFRPEMTTYDGTSASSGISVDKTKPVTNLSNKWNHSTFIQNGSQTNENTTEMLVQKTASMSVVNDQDEQFYCNYNNKEEKQKILAQYAYVEDDEEPEESDGYDSQVEKGSIQKDDIHSPTQTSKAEQMISEKSIEEIRLEKLEQQMKEDYATLSDDASCYMMSKHEIKELKASLKKNEQVAKGLRARIEKKKQKQALELSNSQQVASSEKDVEQEDEGYGSNIFDIPSNIGADAATTSVKQTVKKPIRSAKIGKWSGTNPKELLLDICRKKNLRAPKFMKLSSTDYGCSLLIQLPSKELRFRDQGPFESYQDAQHFVACEALYHLEPDKPLYRLLPPVFQDIWKTWVKEKHDEHIAEIASKEADVDEKIAALIQRIQDHTKISQNASNNQEESKNMDTLSDWDEESSESELSDNQNKIQRHVEQQKKVGDKLRIDFQSRQKLDNYKRILTDRSQLPIFDYRDTILEAIDHNEVTILCAETGAGKTTQAPQFILEDALSSGHGGEVKIVCTQPRRIAAISVAERVAEEMSFDIGGLVGYQIRGESKVSRQTVLSFCTTGELTFLQM